MNRTIKQWTNCDPKAMATNQSKAATYFAFADAKHDILFLHNKNAELLQALERALTDLEWMSARINHPEDDELESITAARAAIAAAKGE